MKSLTNFQRSLNSRASCLVIDFICRTCPRLIVSRSGSESNQNRAELVDNFSTLSPEDDDGDRVLWEIHDEAGSGGYGFGLNGYYVRVGEGVAEVEG